MPQRQPHCFVFIFTIILCVFISTFPLKKKTEQSISSVVHSTWETCNSLSPDFPLDNTKHCVTVDALREVIESQMTDLEKSVFYRMFMLTELRKLD